ncbi:MAG: accessory gene regulator B family protein [Clostridiales bacterium]|nr:accessory gene regulator B family protein [Clostridiales bacterium]
MLKTISVKLTNYYEKFMPLSETDRLKMILGFQNIIHQAGMFFVIFTLAGIFHIFKETLLFLAVFSIYRRIAGDFHLSTSLGCICATSFIDIGGTALALRTNINIPAVLTLFVIIVIVTFILAPRRTKNYPVSDETKHRLKVRSVLLAIFLGATALILPYPFRELVTIATLAESLTLIPNPKH